MALLIPLFIVAAFFLLRANPQRRRVQQQRSLIDALQPGIKVVTVAGIVGTLVGIEGDRAALELAPGVIVEFLVAAIVRVDAEPAGAAVDLTDDHDEPAYDEPDHDLSDHDLSDHDLSDHDLSGHDLSGHSGQNHDGHDHDGHDDVDVVVPEPERGPGHGEEA